jgi:hypothetical protein
MGAAVLRCSNVFCVFWWTRVSRQCFGITHVLEHCCDMYVSGVAHWGIVGGNFFFFFYMKNPVYLQSVRIHSANGR